MMNKDTQHTPILNANESTIVSKIGIGMSDPLRQMLSEMPTPPPTRDTGGIKRYVKPVKPKDSSPQPFKRVTNADNDDKDDNAAGVATHVRLMEGARRLLAAALREKEEKKDDSLPAAAVRHLPHEERQIPTKRGVDGEEETEPKSQPRTPFDVNFDDNPIEENDGVVFGNNTPLMDTARLLTGAAGRFMQIFARHKQNVRDKLVSDDPKDATLPERPPEEDTDPVRESKPTQPTGELPRL